MDISEIDKNLTVCSALPDDVKWFDISENPFKLYGIMPQEEGFCRLPADLAKSVSPALYELSRNTAGGRLRFKTDSPYIAIKVKMGQTNHFSHMAFINSAGFDLYENGIVGSRFAGAYVPPADVSVPYVSSVYTGEHGLRDYTLNFPSYGSPLYVSVGLKAGSQLSKTDGYRNEKPAVFYGSSITQGACASRPGIIYQNYISRRYNLDYINLGFSGNGRAEDSVVEYMSGLDMCAFFSDYDHNAPDVEYLSNTHYKMYEKIRSAHGDIPYVMISKPDFENDPNASLRREVVFESYMRAKKAGDKNVYYIDGQRLFGGADRGNCTTDGCHPNDLGMYRFADAVMGQLENIETVC